MAATATTPLLNGTGNGNGNEHGYGYGYGYRPSSSTSHRSANGGIGESPAVLQRAPSATPSAASSRLFHQRNGSLASINHLQQSPPDPRGARPRQDSSDSVLSNASSRVNQPMQYSHHSRAASASILSRYQSSSSASHDIGGPRSAPAMAPAATQAVQTSSTMPSIRGYTTFASHASAAAPSSSARPRTPLFEPFGKERTHYVNAAHNGTPQIGFSVGPSPANAVEGQSFVASLAMAPLVTRAPQGGQVFYVPGGHSPAQLPSAFETSPNPASAPLQQQSQQSRKMTRRRSNSLDGALVTRTVRADGDGDARSERSTRAARSRQNSRNSHGSRAAHSSRHGHGHGHSQSASIGSRFISYGGGNGSSGSSPTSFASASGQTASGIGKSPSAHGQGHGLGSPQERKAGNRRNRSSSFGGVGAAGTDTSPTWSPQAASTPGIGTTVAPGLDQQRAAASAHRTDSSARDRGRRSRSRSVFASRTRSRAGSASSADGRSQERERRTPRKLVSARLPPHSPARTHRDARLPSQPLGLTWICGASLVARDPSFYEEFDYTKYPGGRRRHRSTSASTVTPGSHAARSRQESHDANSTTPRSSGGMASDGEAAAAERRRVRQASVDQYRELLHASPNPNLNTGRGPSPTGMDSSAGVGNSPRAPIMVMSGSEQALRRRSQSLSSIRQHAVSNAGGYTSSKDRKGGLLISAPLANRDLGESIKTPRTAPTPNALAQQQQQHAQAHAPENNNVATYRSTSSTGTESRSLRQIPSKASVEAIEDLDKRREALFAALPPPSRRSPTPNHFTASPDVSSSHNSSGHAHNREIGYSTAAGAAMFTTGRVIASSTPKPITQSHSGQALSTEGQLDHVRRPSDGMASIDSRAHSRDEYDDSAERDRRQLDISPGLEEQLRDMEASRFILGEAALTSPVVYGTAFSTHEDAPQSEEGEILDFSAMTGSGHRGSDPSNLSHGSYFLLGNGSGNGNGNGGAGRFAAAVSSSSMTPVARRDATPHDGEGTFPVVENTAAENASLSVARRRDGASSGASTGHTPRSHAPSASSGSAHVLDLSEDSFTNLFYKAPPPTKPLPAVPPSDSSGSGSRSTSYSGTGSAAALSPRVSRSPEVRRDRPMPSDSPTLLRAHEGELPMHLEEEDNPTTSSTRPDSPAHSEERRFSTPSIFSNPDMFSVNGANNAGAEDVGQGNISRMSENSAVVTDRSVLDDWVDVDEDLLRGNRRLWLGSQASSELEANGGDQEEILPETDRPLHDQQSQHQQSLQPRLTPAGIMDHRGRTVSAVTSAGESSMYYTTAADSRNASTVALGLGDVSGDRSMILQHQPSFVSARTHITANSAAPTVMGDTPGFERQQFNFRPAYTNDTAASSMREAPFYTADADTAGGLDFEPQDPMAAIRRTELSPIFVPRPAATDRFEHAVGAQAVLADLAKQQQQQQASTASASTPSGVQSSRGSFIDFDVPEARQLAARRNSVSQHSFIDDDSEDEDGQPAVGTDQDHTLRARSNVERTSVVQAFRPDSGISPALGAVSPSVFVEQPADTGAPTATGVQGSSLSTAPITPFSPASHYSQNTAVTEAADDLGGTRISEVLESYRRMNPEEGQRQSFASSPFGGIRGDFALGVPPSPHTGTASRDRSSGLSHVRSASNTSLLSRLGDFPNPPNASASSVNLEGSAGDGRAEESPITLLRPAESDHTLASRRRAAESAQLPAGSGNPSRSTLGTQTTSIYTFSSSNEKVGRPSANGADANADVVADADADAGDATLKHARTPSADGRPQRDSFLDTTTSPTRPRSGALSPQSHIAFSTGPNSPAVPSASPSTPSFRLSGLFSRRPKHERTYSDPSSLGRSSGSGAGLSHVRRDSGGFESAEERRQSWRS